MSAGDVHRVLAGLHRKRHTTLLRSLLGVDWAQLRESDAVTVANGVANTIADLAFGSAHEIELITNGRYVRIEKNDLLFVLGWIPRSKAVSVAIFPASSDIFGDPVLRLRLDISPGAARRWVSKIAFATTGSTGG
jgi:hypothetical protein